MRRFDYPDRLVDWEEKINRYAMMKAEYGASGVAEKVAEIESMLKRMLAELIALPDDEALSAAEPNDLESIRALRPEGERRYWRDLPAATYRERLQGALLGRFAGCTLGSIVEGWLPEKMERWANYLGDAFPPVDYWSAAERPHDLKYQVSPRENFTPNKMDGVPTDDDTIYTQLGLLILEDYGPDFTVEDVGEAWLKYLPYAHTAEEVALDNLRKGAPALEAGEVDNPFAQWIGADIRSDPWGYVAPGYPMMAATLAYRDAYLSHRRNGIYGAMYFAAVIAAAFAFRDPVQALELGLQEIPAECLLAREVRWALDQAPSIVDYRAAHAAVSARHAGMHPVHTINNACLTIFGLTVGGDDFTKVIGETVAMGYDNDCTAATAGSVFGAAYGIEAIPERWTRRFNNKAHTYLIGQETFALDDLIDRFTAQAQDIATRGVSINISREGLRKLRGD